MKRTWKALLALCAAGMTVCQAQTRGKVVIEDELSNGVVIVTIDKAGEEIIRLIDESQLHYIHDPQAPRFLLMDKKGRFALGIGGYIRTTAEYDFGGISENADFIPAYIPTNSLPKNQFQMDASTASIFLKLVGHTDLLGDFVVYTAGNFRGDNRGFRLRNAYMTFRNITVGYTYGGFTDIEAMPSTIDFQGPAGAAIYRATQLAYTYKSPCGVRLHASVEAPTVNGTASHGITISQQRLPNFTAAIQYNWTSHSHLRLGGMVRSMTYTSSTQEKAHSLTGYGLQASGNFLTGKWRLYGQVTYGKGIGYFLNDIGCLNVDIVPKEEGGMQTLPMLGWYAGGQYRLTPKVTLSATYSMSRLYGKEGYATTQGDGYHYGQYLATNAFWNVTPNMQVGAEYLRGWRTDFSGITRHANRINLLLQYSF